MEIHQFSYVFAMAMIFAFLDAFGIGANDVANSFATSVSSRSLTLLQAMLIATVCEFAGAVLAGARVSSTIRSNILDLDAFEAKPEVLMITMATALIGSSLWLLIATHLAFPVSTTHSIVGGVIGAGIAAVGADNVRWGWKGVAQIFASWGIAPLIAGGFASIVFLATKYTVLKVKPASKSLRNGMYAVPVYFFIVGAVLCMVIVYKGTPSLNLDKWTPGQTIGCIFGVAAGLAILSATFLVPFFYRRLVLDDWTITSKHILLGPWLLKRGPVPPKDDNPNSKSNAVFDYTAGGITKKYHDDEKDENNQQQSRGSDIVPSETVDSYSSNFSNTSPTKTNQNDNSIGKEKGNVITAVNTKFTNYDEENNDNNLDGENNDTKALSELEGKELKWYHPKMLFKKLWYYFMYGVTRDVVSEQGKNLEGMHAHTVVYDNKVEHLYSFMQVLTAMTASFAHGSNDVSNAVGPLSSVYLVWNTATVAAKTSVPIWILVYCASAIVIGLWTCGHRLMRSLGNKITFHTPSRGFSMEFGGAVTTVMASQLGIPVSTTQCITGATVAVGLCNGDVKAVNWKVVAWIYFGWILTLPIAGLIAGILNGIIINSPHW